MIIYLMKIWLYFLKKVKSHKLKYSNQFIEFLSESTYSERELIVKTVMEYVKFSELKGDYMEFGVWKGQTFCAAYYFSQSYNLDDMRFFAFDSFKGLPAPTGIDQDGFVNFKEGEYSFDRKSFEYVLKSNEIDMKKVDIVEGWYDDILNDITKDKIPLQKAAVIWIDCDMYISTVPVLNFITEYIQDGTVLLFDDWFAYRADPKRGEQKAFTEWLSKHPEINAIEYRKFGWHGNSFILRNS